MIAERGLWKVVLQGGEEIDVLPQNLKTIEESLTCTWCNARIFIGEDRSRWERRKSSGAEMERTGSQGQDPVAAKACQVCLRWFCPRCRNFSADLESLIAASPSDVGDRPLVRASSPSALMRAFSPSRDSAAVVQCCGECHRYIDGLQWRRKSHLAGFPPSSGLLLAEYNTLTQKHTQLVTHLAQLEGLLRTAEQQNESGEGLHDELQETLESSCASAVATQEAIQASARRIAEVPCPALPHRDMRVREAMVRHAKRLVEDLKPRVNTASTRVKAQRLQRLASEALAGDVVLRLVQ